MRRILVALGALAACSDDTHVEPVAAAATPPVVTAKPKPPAYDSSIPAKPALFGPWASIPFGTSYTDIGKTAPWLLDAPHTSEDDATIYAIDDMFAGVVTSRFVAAIITVAPERLGGWGAPLTIRDELGHGITHELWFDPAARIRIDRQGSKLVIQPYLPLAQYFGKGRFAFEGSRSLLGMTATEATEQINTWASSIHVTTRIQGGRRTSRGRSAASRIRPSTPATSSSSARAARRRRSPPCRTPRWTSTCR